MLFSNARLSSTALPQDIIAEVLVAVVMVSIGLVLGAEKLKPITWRDWAGELERDGGARNPYLGLEERYGFWDIQVRYSILPFLSLCFALFHSVYVERLELATAPRGDVHHYDMKIDANRTPT